jgi:signal transduction histidine kinase
LIRLDREGDYGTLCVADTGTGIPEKVRARVFEPFFTTKGAGGTGLGLPVVRDLVRGLDGRLEVKSLEGQGTTIAVFLPLYRPTPAG